MKETKQEKFISVDIEASGPIPDEYSMLSLGACVVGERDKNFYIELKPLNDNFLPRALEKTKFSMEELKIKGVKPAEAMASFEEWILKVSKDCRPVFVGFNATFDWMFCHWYFMKFLGRDPFGISGLDTKAYYMGMQNCTWSETTKKKVKLNFPTKTKHTHNALQDAIEQAELFEKMLKFNRN